MKPYYEHKGITIYHGDCRDILPQLPKVDLVLTDPPYPNIRDNRIVYTNLEDISYLFSLYSFIFWPALPEFPFPFTARHVWHKPNSFVSGQYEFIYELNGQRVCRLYRYPIINYKTLPEWVPHPTQKPIKLVKDIMNSITASIILDPFLGSGTTLVAAKELGRKAIGIEIEEKYCEIAAKRLTQEVMDFEEPTK